MMLFSEMVQVCWTSRRRTADAKHPWFLMAHQKK